MRFDQRKKATKSRHTAEWNGPAEWGRAALCLAALALLAGVASTSQQMQPPPRPPRPFLLPEANRIPDANDQMEMHQQQDQSKNKDFAAANQERKKQIIDDSARLLTLAGDLKTAVDKANKDTLSLDVIRKADEIERLAHSVKEKMKLTMGAS
jgi:hypothetical protein